MTAPVAAETAKDANDISFKSSIATGRKEINGNTNQFRVD